MKAFMKCIAVGLTAASLLTLGGCAQNNSTKKTATTANWNVRTSTSVESNMLGYWQSHAEVAEYDVSFTEGSNNSYSVTYDAPNATYSTRFYAEAAYDWTSSPVPAEYRVNAETEGALTAEPVYVYETSSKISGTYKMKSSGEEKAFSDEITAVCKYRLAGKNLQPVYSKQIIKNTAPNAAGTNNIEQAYIETDAVYETWYNQDGTQALISFTNNLAEDKTAQISKIGTNHKNGYSLFDNCQLRAAVRAFTMRGGATRIFNVLTPQDNTTYTATATISSPIELRTSDETEKKIIDALNASTPDDYIFFDSSPTEEGDDKVRNYRYNAVSIAVNAQLKGATPTCWYTSVENADLNTTRSVMIKYTTPLPFILGTLSYSLKSLNVKAI